MTIARAATEPMLMMVNRLCGVDDLFRFGNLPLLAGKIVLIAAVATSAYAQPTPTYKTVVLSSGDVKFPLQPTDKDEYEQYCPLNVCTCESDVSYIRLQAQTNPAALDMINRKLKSEASQVSCSFPDTTDTMQQEVTHLSARFVSVVEHSYSQQIATGGSCHGGSAVHTYDVTGGKEYRLADIISRSSLANLRKTLPGSIVKEHNRQDDEAADEQAKANPHGGPDRH
jgi:hypothetical protein